MAIKIIDSHELPNSWRVLDDKLGNYRQRGLPFRYSYVGSFAQALAEYFVKTYSSPGDVILDPFSGRCTVGMQSLYNDRNVVCNDLSPYSNVLCHSVLFVPNMTDVLSYINELEKYINDSSNKISLQYTGKGSKEDISALYEKGTFNNIVKLRNTLNDPKFITGNGFGLFGSDSSNSKYEHEVVMFIRAISTQMMLGSSLTFNGLKVRGADNTGIKSLLKFYDSMGEKPKVVNVFDNLRAYIDKMNLDSLKLKSKFDKLDRKLISCDAKNLRLESKSIDGVITSPPYFHVLSYGKSNWTRLWLLNSVGDPKVKADILNEIKDNKLISDSHGKAYDEVTNSTSSTLDNPLKYSSFTGGYLKELYRVLKDDSFAIIVVGDYGNKKKTEAWRLVVDRAVIFGFKPLMIVMDELVSSTKSSSQFNAKQGGGKNDYDVCIILTKGNYTIKNDANDIDFRWGAKFVEKRQRGISDIWG